MGVAWRVRKGVENAVVTAVPTTAVQRNPTRRPQPVSKERVPRSVSGRAAKRVPVGTSITAVGTACGCVVGVLFGTGWFAVGGWALGSLAFFDVVDGAVARRTGRATTFGSFYDSTLDRVADAFLFGGFVVFYALHNVPRQAAMVRA